MPTNKLFFTAAGISTACSALVLGGLWLAGKGTAPLLLGFCAGILLSAAGLWLLFRAWRAAPRQSDVVLFYALHLLVVFGGVGASLFVPGIHALGVVVPQLFPVPVLAILMCRQ